MVNAAPHPSYFNESDKISIPIEKLKNKEDRAHYLFEASSLAQNIVKNGLKDPLIVQQEGDCYVILDGRHRLAILKLLKWTQVPCYIVT